MLNRIRCLALVLVLLIMGASHLSAQVHLSGKIVSDTNAPVPSATIMVHEQSSSPGPVQSISDGSGAFEFELAHPGNYVVDIECRGFFKLAGRAIVVSEGGAALTLVLTPIREYSESVEVSGEVSPVGLDRSGSEETLSGAEVLDIPYADTPGIKDTLPILPKIVEDSFGGVHLNGASENQTLYTLDGFNIGDPLFGSFDLPVSVEAVRSISVLSSPFPAEYGNGSAGVVEIITNTGDDKFHYSATNFLPVVGDQKGWRILGWNPRFNLSGPLSRRHAWFMNNFIPHYGESIVSDLPPGQDASTDRRFSDYFHAQVNLTPTNILYIGVLGSLSSTGNSGLSALDPAPTTLNLRSRQWFGSIRDQQYFTSGTTLEFGYASNHTSLRQTPQGHSPYISSPSGRSGNYYLDSSQHSSRDQIIVKLSLPTIHFWGTHQLTTGLDLDRIGYHQDSTRGEIDFLNSQQQLIRTLSYRGNGSLLKSTLEGAAYVQQSWHLRQRVSVESGIRLDWNEILRDWKVSPRLGVAFSPWGSGSTKLSGGYAVTRNEPDLRLFLRPDDQYPVSTFSPPYGSGTAVRSIFTIPNQHYSNPKFQTWSLALDRRFSRAVFVHIEGLRGRTSNGLTYLGVPETTGDSIYRLSNRRTEAYDSVEISARQTFGKTYGWLVGYTRSRSRSNAVFDAAADDYFLVPSNVGLLSWDTPNRVVSWAHLPSFRRKWMVSYFLEYRTGFPFSASNDVGVIAGPVNSYRFPDFFDLNLDLERRIRLLKYMWAFRFGFDNITNHFNPSGVNSIVGSNQFGHFNGGQPRTLVFRIRWLGGE